MSLFLFKHFHKSSLYKKDFSPITPTFAMKSARPEIHTAFSSISAGIEFSYILNIINVNIRLEKQGYGNLITVLKC
jgi:hypothetical protein